MKSFKQKFLFSIISLLLLFFCSVSTASAFSLFPNEPSAVGRNADYREYIVQFYVFALPASALIAVVLIMIGGIIWITSAGDQSRVAKAKEFIINSIIGLIILAGVYVILGFINPALVILQPPTFDNLGVFGACYKSTDGSCTLLTQKSCIEPDTFKAGEACDEAVGQELQNAKFAEVCTQLENFDPNATQSVSCTSQDPRDFNNPNFATELCRSTHKYSPAFDIPEADQDCSSRCKSPCLPRLEVTTNSTELICHCEPPNLLSPSQPFLNLPPR